MESQYKSKSILLNIKPDDHEVLNTLPMLEKQGKLPNNQTEVFRRGLHVVRSLVEVHEKKLLELLVCYLDKSAADLSKENIQNVTALSYAIYATFIAKQGKAYAELFESIAIECGNLDFIDKNTDKQKVIENLTDMSISIKTMFLKSHQEEPIGGKIFSNPIVAGILQRKRTKKQNQGIKCDDCGKTSYFNKKDDKTNCPSCGSKYD